VSGTVPLKAALRRAAGAANTEFFKHVSESLD
jgi:hypothetical protein